MASSSRTVFCRTDGQPVKFFIRPSETKARLKPLIEDRGGLVSSKLDASPGWIKLAVSGDKIRSNDYYTAEYVQDCIDSNQLLPLEQYRCELEKTKHSSGEHSVMNNVTISGRSKYDSTEDAAIISYVARHPELSYSGNQIWKKMELLKVTIHPWQSMKHRFLNKLVGGLPAYVKAREEGTISDTSKTSNSKDSSSEDDSDTTTAPDGNTTKNRSRSSKSNGDSESSVSRGSEELTQVDDIPEKADDSSSDFDCQLLEMAKEGSSRMEADSSTNRTSKRASSYVPHQNGDLHTERPRGTNRMQLRSHRQPSGDAREPTGSDEEDDTPDEKIYPCPKRRRVLYPSDSDDQDSLAFSMISEEDQERSMTKAVDAVVAFVKNAMEVYNLSAKTVMQVLYMHSGQFELTIDHLDTGKPPEGFMPWNRSDDKKLKNSTDANVIKGLCEKYGQQAVTDRLEFFQ